MLPKACLQPAVVDFNACGQDAPLSAAFVFDLWQQENCLNLQQLTCNNRPDPGIDISCNLHPKTKILPNNQLKDRK